jgi:3-dehydroquinate synthase
VGDLATIAAATYKRGCFLVQVPTTLLAQVDSCLGGKGAVNFQGIKNLIGLFYPAHLVAVDPIFLQTLPAGLLASGMAEVIKYGLIKKASLFKRLKQFNLASISPHFGPLIKECLAIKKSFIEKDPFDQNERLKLNFGHTLAHAIEATTQGKVNHGEAVAIGILVMLRWGEDLGFSQKGVGAKLEGILRQWQLPTCLEGLDKQKLKQAMHQDKKGNDSEIKLVFIRKMGCAVIKKMEQSKLDQLLNYL